MFEGIDLTRKHEITIKVQLELIPRCSVTSAYPNLQSLQPFDNSSFDQREREVTLSGSPIPICLKESNVFMKLRRDVNVSKALFTSHMSKYELGS